jgi:anti-anti-sigma regulatory factor
MEKLRFLTQTDKNGRIETIEIGGLLVLETALELKNELVDIANRLSNNVKITICDLEEMDLSAVQLLVAFIKHMNHLEIKFQFEWDLDDEQKSLFVNVGIGVELFMNN